MVDERVPDAIATFLALSLSVSLCVFRALKIKDKIKWRPTQSEVDYLHDR